MVAKQSMIGPGMFQWNTLAWFGAQLGSTLWMLLPATAALVWFDPWLAAVCLLCFAIPNALGTWLWLRRDRIAPHTAIQYLALSISSGGLLILAALEWFWAEPVPHESFRQGYVVFLAMPVVMALFYIVERHCAKTRPRLAGRHDSNS